MTLDHGTKGILLAIALAAGVGCFAGEGAVETSAPTLQCEVLNMGQSLTSEVMWEGSDTLRIDISNTVADARLDVTLVSEFTGGGWPS